MNLQYAKHLKLKRKEILGGFNVEDLGKPQLLKDLQFVLTKLDYEIYASSK
jgi:hypothetical protein